MIAIQPAMLVDDFEVRGDRERVGTMRRGADDMSTHRACLAAHLQHDAAAYVAAHAGQG